MPVDIKGYRVFVASPGGLDLERRAFRDTLRDYNEMDAMDRGVSFRPIGWEDTLGGVGRPQSVINHEVRSCDYFVMILWDRWGSCPDCAGRGRYSSGTEEEYHIALECLKDAGMPMKDVIVFFKAVDARRLSDPGPQLQKVLDFRKSLERDKTLLFQTYDEVESFTKVLRKYLASWVRDHERGGQAVTEKRETPPGLVPGGGEAPLIEAQRVAELGEEEDVAEAIKEAWRLANEGQLTDAETKFAELVVGSADAAALNAYGRFLTRVGRLGQAEVMHRQAMETSKALEQKKEMADAYGNLGVIYRTRGELGRAEEMLKESLMLNEALGRRERTASNYGNLGVIYRTRGELDRAEEMLKKSLAIDEALGRKEGMASGYGILGLIYRTRGELDRAEEMHKKSLALNEALGRKKGMANQYGNLGAIYQTRGELDRAEEMHKESLALNEALGRKKGMASTYGDLGLIYEMRRDIATARQYWELALALFKEVGMAPEVRKVQQWLDKLNMGEAGKARSPSAKED